MSGLPENEFDLEKLFLPSWAQEPSSARQYAKYEGGEAPEGRPDGRGPRRDRRISGPGERRDHKAPRGDRRKPGGEGERRGPPSTDRRGFQPRRTEHPRPEPSAPLPEIELTFVPEEKGVESLARQVKITGRAYPLFDIARMILEKPERQS